MVRVGGLWCSTCAQTRMRLCGNAAVGRGLSVLVRVRGPTRVSVEGRGAHGWYHRLTPRAGDRFSAAGRARAACVRALRCSCRWADARRLSTCARDSRPAFSRMACALCAEEGG